MPVHRSWRSMNTGPIWVECRSFVFFGLCDWTLSSSDLPSSLFDALALVVNEFATTAKPPLPQFTARATKLGASLAKKPHLMFKTVNLFKNGFLLAVCQRPFAKVVKLRFIGDDTKFCSQLCCFINRLLLCHGHQSPGYPRPASFWQHRRHHQGCGGEVTWRVCSKDSAGTKPFKTDVRMPRTRPSLASRPMGLSDRRVQLHSPKAQNPN